MQQEIATRASGVGPHTIVNATVPVQGAGGRGHVLRLQGVIVGGKEAGIFPEAVAAVGAVEMHLVAVVEVVPEPAAKAALGASVLAAALLQGALHWLTHRGSIKTLWSL